MIGRNGFGHGWSRSYSPIDRLFAERCNDISLHA